LLGQSANAASMTEYFLPVCVDALNLSYGAQTLNIGFTLTSRVPGTWTTWLGTAFGATELWSVPIPIVSPAATFTAPIPGLPPLGSVVVATVVSTAVGPMCGDAKIVDTGPAGP
jgi:hypothetical protein